MEELNAQSTGIGIDAMSEYLKTIGANDRLLRLTYNSGYSLSLPGQGIVSEPTYSVVDNPTTLLSATPQEVASYLRKRNLSHFILNVRTRLFTTVAFTSLFDPRELPKFLKLSYENNGIVIFTWKDGDEASDIPEYVLTALDLKRTGVLNYPFTTDFYNGIVNGNKLINSIAAYRNIHRAFLTDIDDALSGLLPALSLSSSQDILRRIWSAAHRRVEDMDVAKIFENGAHANGVLRVVSTISEAEFRKRLMAIFVDEMLRQYTDAFGPQLATLSFGCDERVTFAIESPSWAVCR